MCKKKGLVSPKKSEHKMGNYGKGRGMLNSTLTIHLENLVNAFTRLW